MWEPKLVRLAVGDKIRLEEEGAVREIQRVTPAAAYYTVPVERTFEVFNTKTGEHVPITRRAVKVEYVSAWSSVETVEAAPRAKPKVRVDA